MPNQTRCVVFAAAAALTGAIHGPGVVAAAESPETPKIVAQKCLLMAAELLPKVPGLAILRAMLPTTYRTEFSMITGTTYLLAGDITISALSQDITFDYSCRILRGENQTVINGRNVSVLSGSASLTIRD
ncbi:MAG: hypothetical protein GC191_13180 [Azospirillum sp.]|nr:hypothetical protein [Azospirillum sp.]